MPQTKRKVKDSDFTNKLDKKQSNKIVRQFAKKFIESQQDIPPDIAKVVNEHFWELL